MIIGILDFGHFVWWCGVNGLLRRNRGADVCEYKYMIINILENLHCSHFVWWILECTDFWAETEAWMCVYIDIWLCTFWKNPHCSDFVPWILEWTDFSAESKAWRCVYINMWLQTFSKIRTLVILYYEYWRELTFEQKMRRGCVWIYMYDHKTLHRSVLKSFYTMHIGQNWFLSGKCGADVCVHWCMLMNVVANRHFSLKMP